MKICLRKMVIILGVYVIFVLYLLVVCERIERLEVSEEKNLIEVATNATE